MSPRYSSRTGLPIHRLVFILDEMVVEILDEESGALLLVKATINMRMGANILKSIMMAKSAREILFIFGI